MSGSEIRKMLPAEALVRAISQTTGMKFGNGYWITNRVGGGD